MREIKKYMGCDIHAFLEVEENWSDNFRMWSPTSYGELRIGRDYELFSALGVTLRGSLTPVVEPRGLPNNLSWWVEDEAYIQIVDEEHIKEFNLLPTYEGSCHYSRPGESKIYRAEKSLSEYIRPIMLNQKKVILDPDTHTHNWITFEEACKVRVKLINSYIKYSEDPEIKKMKKLSLSKAVEEFRIQRPNLENVMFNSVLASMYCFEKMGMKTRFVYWFDN